MGVGGGIDRAPDRIDDIAPVRRHAVPLEQAHHGEFAHRHRHVANGPGNLGDDRPRAARLGVDMGALGVGQRQFGDAADRIDDRGKRQHRAGDEHDAHRRRDAVRVDRVGVHAERDEDRGRQEREHLREAGERAPGSESRPVAGRGRAGRRHRRGTAPSSRCCRRRAATTAPPPSAATTRTASRAARPRTRPPRPGNRACAAPTGSASGPTTRRRPAGGRAR